MRNEIKLLVEFTHFSLHDFPVKKGEISGRHPLPSRQRIHETEDLSEIINNLYNSIKNPYQNV